MSGVKGRSGRGTKLDEIKRLYTIQRAWDVADELLDSKKFALDKRAAIAAIPIVRSVLSKPVVIDNSKHTHFTTVQVDKLDAQGLMDFIMDRNNGRQDIRQPA